jgi:hypothetical protein
MKLQALTVDEIAGIINSDPTWDDPIRVARLVESVAGARKNDLELIDLMKKVSETRGFSGFHSAMEAIEKLIEDAAFLDLAVSEVVEANVTRCPERGRPSRSISSRTDFESRVPAGVA